MSVAAHAETESTRSQSLLGIVTSMVGILIVLVMLVGERVKRIPNAAPAGAATEADLKPLRKAVSSLEGDLSRAAGEMYSLESEIANRHAERSEMATLVERANLELAARRAKLDAAARARYDLARDLALNKAKIARLEAAQTGVASEATPTLKVESYPTPISKTVEGKEAHFQLKGGRIVWVPLDPLLDRFKSVARDKAQALHDQPELTDTVGPIEGFRLRYTLERFDVPFEVSGGSMRGGGAMVQLTKWELVPVSGQLGESLETALSARSMFRARLDALRPQEYSLTIWVYQDSFNEFRRLRKELYQMGYLIAGRPLPDGVPIGGSPNGSKSAVE